MDRGKEVIMEIDSRDHRGLKIAFRGLLAAVFYGTCSVSSAFVSKALMDTLEFDFPVTIMVSQMIYTILVLELLNVLRIVEMPAFTLKRGYSFAAPAFFYGTNSVLALTALSHMNIAMYGVLKRCVPISTMLLSVLILKKGFPSRNTMIAVTLLSTGCVIAGKSNVDLVTVG